MKKQNIFLKFTINIVILTALIFFIGCSFSQDGNVDKNISCNGAGLHDLQIAPFVLTQVELVNNSGSTVTVFEPVRVRFCPLYPFFFGTDKKLFSVDGNSKSIFEFMWYPIDNLRSTNNPILVNNHKLCCPDLELGETVKNNFQPYLSSFLLKIHIDETDYYLAGWPQSIDFNAYNGGFADFDSGRIVQYGIGYGNNTEARLNKGGAAYLPFIVYHEDEGRTVKYDFSNDLNVHQPIFIIQKAVITVDAAGKIDFKTESFSLPPDGFYPWL